MSSYNTLRLTRRLRWAPAVVLASVSLLLVISPWLGADHTNPPASSDAASTEPQANTEPPSGESTLCCTGPLADYVAAEDLVDGIAIGGWTERRSGEQSGAEFAELTLTSQQWQGTTWRHQLFLFKPATLSEEVSHGLLVLAGGDWNDQLATETTSTAYPRISRRYQTLAEQIQAPVAVLYHVPQQPLLGQLREDAAIAYTFQMYLRTGEDHWPLLLPMVKSSIKAMDAVQEFALDRWDIDLQSFTLTGASKRGWTTWLCGAIDSRVAAIAPVVIDMLNLAPQMEHQLAAWGEYSEQLTDYTRLNLPQFLQTEAGSELCAIVDPYCYRHQIRQPKLIVLGTNDPYWPIDALNLYWDDLEGEKHILYLPNTGHSLGDGTRVNGSLAALHRQEAEGISLPQLQWSFDETDSGVSLQFSSDIAPVAVRMWTAHEHERDFRNAHFTATELSLTQNIYPMQYPRPETGFDAIFLEAEFAAAQGNAYFSSTVHILAGAEEE